MKPVRITINTADNGFDEFIYVVRCYQGATRFGLTKTFTSYKRAQDYIEWLESFYKALGEVYV